MAAQRFSLVCFAPGSPPDSGIGVRGEIAWSTSTILRLLFHLDDIQHCVKHGAPLERPTRRDELWRTTCFELFARVPGEPRYWEYNLSPSGDWNVYRFSDYRAGMVPEIDIEDIVVCTETTPAGLVGLTATLPLPPALIGQRLAIAISAVIEDRSGGLTYFALRHTKAKPDFHDPDSFVLQLDPPSAE